MTENKHLSVIDFINEGFLQEANRLFFHPRGLALSIDLENSVYDRMVVHILDGREDEEGYIFGENMIDPNKIDCVRKAFAKHMDARLRLLGDFVQELTDRERDRLSDRNPEASTELSEHCHYTDRGSHLNTTHGVDDEQGFVKYYECRRCGMKWDKKGELINGDQGA